MRFNFRFLIAIVIGLFSLISYWSARSRNPITNDVQHVTISPGQEIALGLQSAPQMEQQYGGESTDAKATARVQRIGAELSSKTDAKATPYQFQYHLLADPETVNAFALPGGQVFITEGLYRRLETDGQLAGVLGHETGHVIGRHSAEQLAKQTLTQGLTGAAVIASYDPNHPSTMGSAAVAEAVAQLVTLRFGRKDELEADQLGVRLMAAAGYDPHAMIGVMDVLDRISQGNRTPEFFSTHPNPGNRKEHIEEDIKARFPQGVPTGLKP